MEPGYPAPIRQMFPKLPPSVTTIHAAYERPDGGIVLFTGSVFWVYDGVDFTEGSPRPLTDYGLPEYVDRVDAVQVWAKNGSGEDWWGVQMIGVGCCREDLPVQRGQVLEVQRDFEECGSWLSQAHGKVEGGTGGSRRGDDLERW